MASQRGLNPFDYLRDLFTRLPSAKITEIKQSYVLRVGRVVSDSTAIFSAAAPAPTGQAARASTWDAGDASSNHPPLLFSY